MVRPFEVVAEDDEFWSIWDKVVAVMALADETATESDVCTELEKLLLGARGDFNRVKEGAVRRRRCFSVNIDRKDDGNSVSATIASPSAWVS